MGWLAAGVLYSLTYLLVGWWLREQLVALVYLRAAALLVPPLLAVIVIVRRRHLWAGCQWLFWATVVLGLMISAIGLVGWTIDAIQLARGTSWLGWYAVFLLFGGAAPLFALLAQPHRGRRERAAATTAVDIAGIAVLSGFLYSHVVTATWVTPARGDDLDLTLLLLSELQQFLVLAGMTAAALLARRQGWGATYRRLAWGMLVHFVALSLTNAEVWQVGYWSGSVYDCTLILPYFFYPWAVQVAPSSADSPSEADDPEPTTRPWLIFGALALIPLIDYGLASALPREALSVLGGFRELSLAVTVVSVLPLLMARLAVGRAEVKELEAEFRQAQKMEAVGLLAGGVAHDFNNQLTAIYGYTEAVLSQLTEEKPLWADLQQIRQAALRAGSLTQQLLAFGRRQLLQIEAVDLNAVLSNVEPMLRRLIREDIRIEMRLSPQLDRIKADPTQLEHVIVNLAVNARDAMPHGGTLALETTNVELDGHHRPRSAPDLKPGRYARLTVRDDGSGMDAATRARLFEPFFTTKEKGKGTGLGLATAYGIVKQLGGEICVESAPNQGSTFTLYFLATTEALPVQTERTERATALVGTETILLVEDEPFVRDFAATMLRRYGFHVLEACAPEEALALAARTPVLDLVLTDVVMPGMSGPQMLDRLRAQRPVRALLMSGYTDREIIPRGLPGQEVDLLHKPFGLHDLLRKVRAALDAEPLDAPPSR